MAKKSDPKVTFYSKYASLRVVIVPRSRSLIDGKFITSPGKTAEFHRGEYHTADKEIIDALRERASYGIDYFESQKALDATVNAEPIESIARQDETLEVARPRTRKGQRAAVKAKATTAEDIDADAPAEGDSE